MHVGAGATDVASLLCAIEGPKSLDRYDFSLNPMQRLSPEDGAATLTAFTAETVALALRRIGVPRPRASLSVEAGERTRACSAR